LFFPAQDDNRAGVCPAATSQLILSSTMLFDWNAQILTMRLPECYMRASEKASILV